MDRLVFHRGDVQNILRAAEEAGRALAREQDNPDFARGYATAMVIIAASFGFPTEVPEIPRPANGRPITVLRALPRIVESSD